MNLGGLVALLNSLNSLKANGSKKELRTTLNSLLSALVVLLLRLEVGLRVLAGWADARCILRLADKSAVAALPPYLAVAVEEITVGNAR